MKNPIRLYVSDRGQFSKVGNFDTREAALEVAQAEYPYDAVFVYTIVDQDSPVNSSMIMQFNID